MMKIICIVTCYKDPDYIRAKTLRSALHLNKNYKVIEIKNKYKGLLRYPEVIFLAIRARLTYNPDAYILTFRGYEVLPFIRLITLGKPLIFDEFINLIEWLIYEHKKLTPKSLLAKAIYFIYKLYLLSTQTVLTDTDSHANYSSNLMKINREKFLNLPVATDEEIFKRKKYINHSKPFRIFFYSNMLPLHGLSYVLEAAVLLKNQDIIFRIIGGGAKTEVEVKKAKAKGAIIQYSQWVNFEKLPEEAANSDICLGGPFGKTVQSKMVITGKTYQFLSLGVPTIVGKNQETEAIFADKINALMVEMGSANSLANAIKWGIKNKDKLSKIGHSGHMIYKSKLSVGVVSTKLSTRLDQLFNT